MRVAFYAPLKSPDSQVPSGDRLIGRMLLRALEANGHDVRFASRLRTFDAAGDAERQARLARLGAWQADRCLRRYTVAGWRPDLCLTYHLYHKAPDWIGPQVARRLGIPYCVVEASSSPRQATGPWARGHQAVAAGLAGAACVISINPKDVAGIAPLVGAGTKMITMAPFIDGAPFALAQAAREAHRTRLAARFDLDPAVPWLAAVGMLRAGDKLSSYEVLACAVSMLSAPDWHLIIVGDGQERRRIEAAFAPVMSRVRFIGAADTPRVAEVMAASDILVWPAVNEAIGMVFVEAAMAGLPVVGADRPGIAAVVHDGETGLLVPEGDARRFAAALDRLIADPVLRRAMGEAARRRARLENDLSSAGRVFCRHLEEALP